MASHVTSCAQACAALAVRGAVHTRCAHTLRHDAPARGPASAKLGGAPADAALSPLLLLSTASAALPGEEFSVAPLAASAAPGMRGVGPGERAAAVARRGELLLRFCRRRGRCQRAVVPAEARDLPRSARCFDTWPPRHARPCAPANLARLASEVAHDNMRTCGCARVGASKVNGLPMALHSSAGGTHRRARGGAVRLQPRSHGDVPDVSPAPGGAP